MATEAATVSSTAATGGEAELPQAIAVAEVHAAVAQAAPSSRTLGVVPDCPKASPATERTPAELRAVLSTPMKLTTGAGALLVKTPPPSDTPGKEEANRRS